MLRLNTNFSQPSVNQYKKQQNSLTAGLNDFSKNLSGDTVSFGNRLPIKDAQPLFKGLLKKVVKQEVLPSSIQKSTQTFLGNIFVKNHVQGSSSYISVADFDLSDALKLVSAGNAKRDITRKVLGELKPEQFDEWAKKLIKSDKFEGEFFCTNSTPTTSAVGFTKFSDSIAVSTNDGTGRIGKEMGDFILEKANSTGFSTIVKMDDGSKWRFATPYKRQRSSQDEPVRLLATKLLD